MLASFSTALVCWYRKDLFADPPPLAISRNLYSAPGAAYSSLCAGRVDLEELPAERLAPGDPVRRQQTVLRGVLAERQQVGVGELGHRGRFLGRVRRVTRTVLW